MRIGDLNEKMPKIDAIGRGQGQRNDDRCQKAEDRGRKTEDREQRSEVRGQRTEV